MKRIVLLCLTLCAFSSAQAAVINSADINGFRTFQDTNTGLVWLDLDNFFGMSVTQMIGAANAAGFTFATIADVQALLNTLPLGGGEWAGYDTIMGGAPNRPILWGAYDDGFDPDRIGWAYAENVAAGWTISDNSWDLNSVPNGGGDFADMNLFAYQIGRVPEPSILALIGVGLAGVGFMRRRA